MATVVVRRPMRRPGPEMPSGELVLDAPPELPAAPGRGWTQALMVLPMVAMMAAMVLLFSGNGTSSTIRYVVFGLFGVAIAGMIVVSFLGSGGASKREMAHARRRYLRELAQHRMRVARTARRQREALWYLHPEPDALWSVAASHRLWERRRGDADFGAVRIGLGRQSLAKPLVAPDTKPLEQLEPLSALALRRFITTYSAIGGLPLALAVDGFARIHFDGDQRRATGLVRAMLAQLAVLQPPDDVRIAVCAGPDRMAEWDWVKWLPHAQHPERTDALGPLRLVANSITTLEVLLEDVLANRPRFDPQSSARASGPHLVVVLDGGSFAGSDHLMTLGGVEGVTLLDLTTVPPGTPEPTVLVLDLGPDGTLTNDTGEAETVLGQADRLPVAAAEALARQLAPLRLTAASRGEQPLSAELGLESLLELGDPFAFDPADTWLPRPSRDRLRVRFGIRPDGTPIELDLKESAQDGMGPHGLLIGATGSGKSELLRTLVLALAITHPPNTLNFALIDFKGGATFTRLDRLPHTSAVITNLAEELPLVDRMTEAINGELIRRQELLRAAGNFSSLRDYEKARNAGAPLPEVPTLLVVCDEFSELLSARPDFIDMFVQIGRVGRSLGVHLLLASQRLEEGRLRGLDTHLSYRIGLRTFSEIDSRVVLGVTDAFTLPRAPGHGFLKFGDEPMVRFRSAYVSGVHTAGAAPPAKGPVELPGMQVYSTAYVAPPADDVPEDPPAEDPDEAIGESLMDILVDRFTGRGVPAHQIWLSPLAEPPTLDGLLGTAEVDVERGLQAGEQDLRGSLKVVAGVVDRPLEQRRDPLVLDLSAAAGHVVVTGAPRSGKSTALRSIITSLSLTHTPREVQFYCLDFGGGSLSSLRGLPHVGGVAGRQNVGAVRRTVAELSTVLSGRERRFAEDEVDGMAAYRQLHPEDDRYGDVFLVVDGWSTLRKDFEDLEDVVGAIAARGLAYGVHIIATCSRSFDLRPNVRDLFGSRIELRLGDPIDTAVDRTSALNVPENSPGRGITSSGYQLLMALPRADGRDSVDDLPTGVSTLVAAVRAAWQGEPAPNVRLLPAKLVYEALPPRDDPAAHQLTIGIAEQDLAPVQLDFAADAHLLLLGDADSGKTAFLRALARRITESYLPGQARILLVDHRRGLLGEVGQDHLLGYGTDLATTTRLMNDAARAMADRLPGPDVTPEQLRARSWWQGPELFVLVDDYDLVASAMENPFLPLMDYLAQGRDIGLHVVLTRRTGGAGRALFEQFLARVRDIGSPGLMLSGDREEGPLFGGLKPETLPPGRGRLITRRDGARLLQLAWLPPRE
ncbi:type VII secretion protein EccCa [Amycolatopsis jiangsuensis]|uniref:S-DNA-T family DNA segregation ATPase FtsK/SpoIIIE n=1 Tax=Amycolatopsis jiangsuensis TaxID=1181879 RepID=A0A840J4M1_9PSEU|nr:type VII secretion protein EccCa [Amycolatopsis jiangsuensis]MBB4688387.1 S-DNA-T family DNA segregation ATPase FtsK/SpoIIIE [Amycolatopsis jiangsuensis]